MSGLVEIENAYIILVRNCEFQMLLGDVFIEVRLILSLIIMIFFEDVDSTDLAHIMVLASGSFQHGNNLGPPKGRKIDSLIT
jgi:hypothetical protein